MCFFFLWKTPMLLSSFPVLIYSTTEKGQPPFLLKSEIDSTSGSHKIPKLVKTIIMLTLPQIFKRKKTVLLKELVKRCVCVCYKNCPIQKASGLNLKMKGASCSS